MYKQQNKNINKPETKNIHWSRRDRKTRKREVTREAKLKLKLKALCCENSKEVKEKDCEKQNRNFFCCFHGWLSVHITSQSQQPQIHTKNKQNTWSTCLVMCSHSIKATQSLLSYFINLYSDFCNTDLQRYVTTYADLKGLPRCSVIKEFACNAGDADLIPRLRR